MICPKCHANIDEQRLICKIGNDKLMRVVQKHGFIYSVGYVLESWFGDDLSGSPWFLINEKTFGSEPDFDDTIDLDDYELQLSLVPKDRTKIYADIIVD